MYTGPSPRNLGLSVLLHGAAITGLMNVPVPVSEPPDPRLEARSTEFRLNGKLYYVAQIEGSNSSASKSAAPEYFEPQGGRDCRTTRRRRGPVACAHSRTGRHPGGDSRPRSDPRTGARAAAAGPGVHPAGGASQADRNADADTAVVAAGPGASAHAFAELPRADRCQPDAQRFLRISMRRGAGLRRRPRKRRS